MGENVFKLRKNDSQEHTEESAAAGADAAASVKQAGGTVPNDPTKPRLVPNRIESITPYAFKRFLEEHKAITDVMIHENGSGPEVRTVASENNGGVSRFGVDAEDRKRFEQIANDAGYERTNKGMTGIILLHKK